MRLKIDRKHYTQCTIGRVTFGKFSCFSIELPWLNNAENISCIPPGIYRCNKISSPKNGKCFEVMDVMDRTDIQGHVGNYTSNILGCIAFGDSVKHKEFGEIWVTNSRVTFGKLMDVLPNTFIIEVGL